MSRKGGHRLSDKDMHKPKSRETPAKASTRDRSEAMSLKRFSRAGLIGLIGAILLGITLSLPTYHAAFAQAAGAPADAAAAAAPPACSATVLEKCTPNSGDTAWMMTSMAIVLMMTIPGLALFYGGMVRKKNVGDTVMTSF